MHNETGLRLAGLISLAGITGPLDPTLALWSTAFTVIGSVILQILKDRRERQRHEEEREDRREVARLARESTEAILHQGRRPADARDPRGDPLAPLGPRDS
jgi:hypothetical protein